jgi:hypothetical protein
MKKLIAFFVFLGTASVSHAITYTDSFTLHGGEIAGEDLASHTSLETGATWYQVTSTTASLKVFNGGRVAGSGYSSFILYNSSAIQATADSEASVGCVLNTAPTAGTDASWIVTGRMSQSGSGYVAIMYAQADQPAAANIIYQLGKFVNGAPGGICTTPVDPLITISSMTAGITPRLRISFVGSSIRVDRSTDPVNVNYVNMITCTDTDYPNAGYVGVGGFQQVAGSSMTLGNLINFNNGPISTSTSTKIILTTNATGTAGIPQNITVTTDGTISTSYSVSLTDGSGGTFGTNPVTINSGTPSVTTTYTPASHGVKNLTGTPTGSPPLSNGTVTITVGDLIPMNDPNLYLSDNWLVNGSPVGAASTYDGAIIKGAVQNTTTLKVIFDVSPEVAASVTAGDYPSVYIQTDGLQVPLQLTTQLSSSGGNLMVVSCNLDNTKTVHYFTIFNTPRAWATTENIFTANGSGYPDLVTRVYGIAVDNGIKTVSLSSTPIALKPKRVRLFGDSKMSGAETVAVAHYNTLGSIGNSFANALNAEATFGAFSGSSFMGGAGQGIGPFGFPTDYWKNYFTGSSLLDVNGHFKEKPDYVLIYMTNDVHQTTGITLAVGTTTITEIRAAIGNPITPIILAMPDVVYSPATSFVQYPGPLRTSINNIYNAYHPLDSKFFVIDLGEDEAVGTDDGTPGDPNGPWGPTNYHIGSVKAIWRGAAFATQIQKLNPPVAGGGVGIGN